MNFTILLIFQTYGSAWKLKILLCFLYLWSPESTVESINFLRRLKLSLQHNSKYQIIMNYSSCFKILFDKLEVFCSKVYLINFIL